MEKIEKHVAEKYNAEHGGAQPAQQEQPAQAQQQAPPPAPPKEEHHHGKDVAKKLGNAATFGAGATAGADAVNGLINNV